MCTVIGYKVSFHLFFYPDTKRRKIGRPSTVSKIPEFIPKLQEIITQGSTAAQSRRRDDVQYSFGVSLANMQQQVKDDLGVTVSKHTIHRALLAPHLRWRTARLYKGYVNARVPPKSNCKTTKEHKDFRYTCVQVNLVNEFAACYSEEVLALSCDDKNKINIGTPAVSRYCKYQSFFDTQNLPDLPDHDFPLRNSKLTPSGYLVLTQSHKDRRSRSASPPVHQPGNRRRNRSVSPPVRHSPQLRKDVHGRDHVTWSRNGELYLFLHSDRFFQSTSQMHCNHLITLLPPMLNSTKKSVVTIICDGGPDWRTDSPANIINYGRVWRSLNLDALILTSYAPYHSRYNPIERGWSPLTKWLVGTILPATLPNESVPPQQQKISDAEKREKIMKVHDNAMKVCSNLWTGRTWGGFPVSVANVPCDGTTLIYRDHDMLRRLTNSPQYALRGELKHTVEEYKFFSTHLVRKTYQLEFIKCKDIHCLHCRSRPVRARNCMAYIERHGNCMPTPSKSASHPGHFATFLDTLTTKPRGPHQIMEFLPSDPEPRKSCSLCRYIPSTPTDEKRHQKLVHQPI